MAVIGIEVEIEIGIEVETEIGIENQSAMVVIAESGQDQNLGAEVQQNHKFIKSKPIIPVKFLCNCLRSSKERQEEEEEEKEGKEGKEGKESAERRRHVGQTTDRKFCLVNLSLEYSTHLDPLHAVIKK